MAKLISAASLVRYNANVRGNDVGDCVCRSISFAFDIPYSQAGKLLNAEMKKLREDRWNRGSVYRGVIKSLGGSDRKEADELNISDTRYPTVEEFADAYPTGCYLVVCGRDSNSKQTSHIVCIIDNVIYDSWDCRKYYAKHYYICSEDRHIEEHGIEDSFEQLLEEACDLADIEIGRYTLKWIKDGESCKVTDVKHSIQGVIDGYNLKLSCRFSFFIEDDIYEEDHGIRFPMNVTLRPGLSLEDARTLMTKTIKQRAYDRMYKVRDTVKDCIEEFESKHQNGANVANQEYLFLTSQEKRFINQLPAKVRPFITHIYIYSPGQHSNSYTVKLNALPNDPNQDPIRFEAYESKGAQEMIKRYAKTFERPWDDYDPAEEGYT